MKRTLFTLLTISTLFTSAQNSDIYNKILNQLNLKEDKIKESLVCYKQLPNNREETIYVIPEIATQEDDFMFSLNSYILITESNTGKIKHKYFESYKTNNWSSDAIKLNSITIDTAPYRLNKKSRAFGIRISYRGSSRVNPYGSESLSLFIKKGNTLKKVVNNLIVYEEIGEWDGMCAGEFNEEKSILIISKKKSNGFSNIILSKKNTTRINKEEKNGDCSEKVSSTRNKKTLKYNGTCYK
jgi:hypothetical protein